MNRWLTVVNTLLSIARNVLWLVPALLGFLGVMMTRGGAQQIVSVVASLCLFYTSARIFVLERRLSRSSKAARYLHQLVHQLRDGLERESESGACILRITPTFSDHNSRPTTVDFGDAPEEDIQGVIIYGLLSRILDNAAHYFREVTGKHCTSSLIMPISHEPEGVCFMSVMYCSDVDPERKEGAQAQRGGLCAKAFAAEGPMRFDDYDEELRKGDFVVTRTDWRRWYSSGLMTHFKVDGKPHGILNIDSRHVRVFRDAHLEIAAAFADACALVLNLAEPK